MEKEKIIKKANKALLNLMKSEGLTYRESLMYLLILQEAIQCMIDEVKIDISLKDFKKILNEVYDLEYEVKCE